jgi:hypothetical protein
MGSIQISLLNVRGCSRRVVMRIHPTPLVTAFSKAVL